MTYVPRAYHPSPRKKTRSCLTCLVIAGISLALLVCILIIAALLFGYFGGFGRQARDVYQLAPDPVASQQLREAFSERNIAGVQVYVIPIKGEPRQGAFIILDASKGYTGLSPLDGGSAVFLDLLKDLTRRNRTENLRIAHLTVDYRDEQGKSLLAFTVDQKLVEDYAEGRISKEAFYQGVHFNLLKTLQRMGLEEFLEGTQK